MNTSGLTVVHQWGHPADMDKILKIADKYNLRVVEDCSHAHGSRYKGRLCGTFGDVAVFSLQANKAIFAGEGGILVTNNETIYNRATLIGHYRDRSKEDIADPDYQKYWVSGFGLKLRMSPFNAIVAKHSLSLYPKRKEGRHKCLNYFNERLKEIDYITPLSIPENIDMGAWYGFKPLFKAGVISLSREEFVHMMQKQGMEISAPSGGALASLPLYSESPDLMYPNKTSKYQNDIRSCPICQKIEDTGLSLPTFYDWDNDKELIDEYIELFKEVLDKYRL